MKKIIRTALIITGTFLLVLFLIPMVCMAIINAGNLAGIAISSILILWGIFMTQIMGFFSSICKKVSGKILTGLLCVIVCFAIVLTVFSGITLATKFSIPPQEPTVAIVLGCKVNPNGPSLMLQARINAAYDFLKNNPDTKCIVSGGMGSDEHMSEALCMYNELTAMGIDKERIFIEDKSTNTKENLAFSLDIINRENLPRTVTIITNEFHQYRASQIALSHGLKTYHVSGRTPFYMFPTYFLREMGGVIIELIF